MEVVVWRAMLLDETGNNVKWSAIELWKMRLDVEERQMKNAELDDVDEKNASCDVEGSGLERWGVCPDDGIEIETGTNERPRCLQDRASRRGGCGSRCGCCGGREGLRGLS